MTDSLLDEFQRRRALLSNLAGSDAPSRLSGFWSWLVETPSLVTHATQLATRGTDLLANASAATPPQASTPEEIAGVGLAIIKLVHDGNNVLQIAYNNGIRPRHGGKSVSDLLDALMERFVDPALDHLARLLPSTMQELETASPQPYYPLAITGSLSRFRTDHPDPRRAAFLMMAYGTTRAHDGITTAIRDTLRRFGCTALRADDKEYHEDLFPNIQTYAHGCGWGIAVFERLQDEYFNPNVSLEVGYMKALGKSVCLLKDETLRAVQTDLVGKLYRPFDPQDPNKSIPEQLEKWMEDKDILG